MSYVIAAPEMIASAASDVANIGSTLNAANAAAAAPTTGLVAAAGDEVSAAIASLFSAHAQAYQALGAQWAAFHEEFVQNLTAGAGSYVGAEAANAAAFTANPAASAAAAQLAPRWMEVHANGPLQPLHALARQLGEALGLGQLAPLQPLHAFSSQLAGPLGLSPVTTPVPSDSNLMTQTTNLGPLSKTYTVDPDDNFVQVRYSTPPFTFGATSGFQETLGVGVPGQTIITFQSPVSPVLNASLALPVTDPLVPVFAALLPLGF
jgi:hypothetical protein